MKATLTHREVQVLQLIADGHTNQTAGKHLSIAASTVSYSMAAIFAKLRVHTRAEAVRKAVEAGIVSQSTDTPAPIPLTDREYQVLWYVAQGASNADIAGHMGITPGTARVHVYNVFRKIGASNRSSAVAAGLRLGLIDPAVTR